MLVEATDGKTGFVHQLGDVDPHKPLEPAFVNDNYWPVFHFHAYWDTSATVTDQGMYNLPTANGSAELIPVKYPAEVNSTSTKTTALGTLSSSMVWLRSRVSSSQRGIDGKPLHEFFTNVSVKLTGSDT